jgi:hypothetical protein
VVNVEASIEFWVCYRPVTHPARMVAKIAASKRYKPFAR